MIETETRIDLSANEKITLDILQKLAEQGVSEFCLCPGARNAPFITALEKQQKLKAFYWYEERSAAFFALGRIKATNRPVAVVTTSGTAAGELLPAAMEAYYSGLPLVLITADRPRSYRGSGAPQTAEQVGLYGSYATYALDIAEAEEFNLRRWEKTGPMHINVCFDEPLNDPFNTDLQIFPHVAERYALNDDMTDAEQSLKAFLTSVQRPLVVVSTIRSEAREEIARFLADLGAPVFLEGISGLREHPALSRLRVHRTEGILGSAQKHGYPIDGILRIGGVPTFRLWRDLENRELQLPVCSISDVPFSGLSWGDIALADLKTFFGEIRLASKNTYPCEKWLQNERRYEGFLRELFLQEPKAEQSLFNTLSKKISASSTVYLGNSLPIREWDAYACGLQKNHEVYASRGLNGIDGQISTFLGLCLPGRSNWGIFGDLTTLYDMAAPWILPQLPQMAINLVVVNNYGGKIFERMFPSKQMMNPHGLSFASLAAFWGLSYLRTDSLSEELDGPENRLIELVPDPRSTDNFWKKKKDYE